MKIMIVLILIIVLLLSVSGCTQKSGENLTGQVTEAHNRENTSNLTHEILNNETKDIRNTSAFENKSINK